jgi:hypothetical protein
MTRIRWIRYVTEDSTMKRIMLAVTLMGGVALVLALATQPVRADDAREKYHKYMEKYYDHLEEAQEEAAEGDWDDYREELRDAEKNYAKAQLYAPAPVRHGPRGRGFAHDRRSFRGRRRHFRWSRHGARRSRGRAPYRHYAKGHCDTCDHGRSSGPSVGWNAGRGGGHARDTRDARGGRGRR